MNSLSWSLFVPTLATSVTGGGKVSSSPCVAMNEHWCSAHSSPFMVDLKVWAICKCSWYISCVRRKHTSLGIFMPLILKLPVTEVCRGESKLGRWKCITNVHSCFTHFSLSHLGQLLSRPPVCLRTQQNNGSRSSVDDFTDFPQAPAMLESAKKMIHLLLKIDFDIIQTNLYTVWEKRDLNWPRFVISFIIDKSTLQKNDENTSKGQRHNRPRHS